jgi:serine/threonine protein kinase
MSGLRIKTPERRPIVSYDEMKQILIKDGLFDYDRIISDDRPRSVCMFEKEGMKFVLKLGNHAARNDTTKFNLLKNEDKVYSALAAATPAATYSRFFPAIIDSGSATEGFYYLIMEFVEGRTFFDYINEAADSPPPLKTVLTILLNFTLALQTMWAVGLVHGDLSAENVMIEQDLSVKLIDFEKSSKELKLRINTLGSTVRDPDGLLDEGLGYLYLVIKLLSVAKSEKTKPLVVSLRKIIADCTGRCEAVYADCAAEIKRVMQTGGHSRSRRANRGVRKTKRAAHIR